MRVVFGLVMAGLVAFPVDLPAQTALSQSDTGAERMTLEITGTEAGFEDWLAGFRTRALEQGIDAALFDRALRGASFDPDIVRKDRNQSEFTKTIWDYLDSAVSDARVEAGRRAIAQHDALLREVEDRYGVDRHVVAAIWGLETAYGSYMGDTPTLAALATLAYDGRRAAFFERELIAALRIVAAGDVSPERMKGSWAGAMGHTQFMPSSFLAFAVDHDGDGRRDIWDASRPADGLGSAAAYLAHWGWTKGMPWGLEITLPEGFDYEQTSERVKKPVADWQAMGVRAVDGGDLPDHGAASVLLPAGHRGAAFLIFSNFQVIERYNTADAYVIGVGHLADRLQGGPPIRAPWPREDRALTLDERLSLQRLLTESGFDTFGVDGRIGPNTIAAIRAFQRSRGMVPDGYANPALIDLLR
ncbi:lytic murein transglycosylase [Aliigemmobacter aestuarii]|uniref:Lytic murein transglycosylase n=1 Tax=Aliigemmobacter aestuarii TaxID=1445661 RepID=A0A4S3MMA8_9RHOB|nr:lytic murein transglycosylase [Gemmobacter aestuarii]THD83550.1 lytic murein transglycosylase [Gemmobacter aestuarii]